MNTITYVDNATNTVLGKDVSSNELDYKQSIRYELATLDNYYYVRTETIVTTVSFSTLFNWKLVRYTNKEITAITETNYSCNITEQIFINDILHKEFEKTIEHNGKPTIAKTI
jgi:hypothetical protein